MTDPDQKSNQNLSDLSDEELRLALEKEIEQSVTEEIDRIREEKRSEYGITEELLPPAPDFRPKLSDFHAERPSAKKRSVGRGFSYFFVFLLLIAAIASAFLLLYSLYKDQIDQLFPSDGEDPSQNVGNTLSSEGGASDRTPNDAAGDVPSADTDSGALTVPSGGFSSKDAVLTVETFTEETRAEDGTLVFTMALDLPKLSYPVNPLAEKRISAVLQELSAKQREDAKGKAEEYAGEFLAGASPGSYEVRWSSMSAKDGILTLTATVTVGSGGASPLTTVECSNFSAATGELLALSDVVTDPGQLAALSVSHVEKSLVWEEIYENVIFSTVCDSWYPSAEGVVLIYQKYSIGPGASGTIEVLIPYDELEGILSARLTEG